MTSSHRRVLITGATGFVGSNLARRLVLAGHEVNLLVRPRDSRWRLATILDYIRLHEGTLQSQDRLNEIVATVRPEWVFHLATYGAYASQRDVATIVSTNYVGTANLLEACLQTDFEAFVNTGTSSEYGYQSHAPVETVLTSPNSYYSATKAGASLYCRFFAQHHRRPVTTLRLYSVFGPWEDPTRLLPTLAVFSLSGKLPPLVSPNIARDFVYIEDVLDAFLLAAEKPGEPYGSVFNVGTGIQTTIGELVNAIRGLRTIDAEPSWGSMEARDWDTDVWICDASAFRDATGWIPKYSVLSGLEALIDWFEENPDLRMHYETRRTPPC